MMSGELEKKEESLDSIDIQCAECVAQDTIYPEFCDTLNFIFLIAVGVIVIVLPTYFSEPHCGCNLFFFEEKRSDAYFLFVFHSICT